MECFNTTLLDFGRDPALGDLKDEDWAVDYAMRMGRKRKCKAKKSPDS